MRYRDITRVSLVVLTGLVAGCSGVTITPNTPETTNDQLAKGPQSSLTGSNEPLFTTGTRHKDTQTPDSGGSLAVNAYLWRGALDTLSFMPLLSADAFGGVIITDWYQPPSASGERFKATAYVLGRQLRADGVKVSIFRQVLQNGTWVDAPVAQSTVDEIENKVLARARELRTTPGA